MEKLIEINPVVFDEEADYFPLYQGLKPSSMGLKKLVRGATNPEEKGKVFLFGPSFLVFRESKLRCRREQLGKYYQTKQSYPEIIQYIVETLVSQNREHFSVKEEMGELELECYLTQERLRFNQNWELIGQTIQHDLPYVDAFDALACQVPEDLVIHHVPRGQLNPLKSETEKQDFAAVIHLCHANGWNAEWAIGQNFDFIHKEVPRINQIIPNATRMMLSFLNREVAFERLAAISIKTSAILNRHESFEELWLQPFTPEQPLMHLRVERQTVSGFPVSEAFLFTIRTFIYDLDSSRGNLPTKIKQARHQALVKAVQEPDPRAYAYEVFVKHQADLLRWLNSLQFT